MAEPKKAAAEEDQSTGVHDRVVMASRRADGVTPAQSGDWEFIGPKDAVKEGARHQHVSAALAELEPVTSDGPVPSKEEREKVVGPAEKRADAEVEAKHRGLGDDAV
ncbi:MAG: hypothetical protein JWO98_4729 [Frankiales bacterium]|nr:hypothetical protein [Frankiales bacterium]